MKALGWAPFRCRRPAGVALQRCRAMPASGTQALVGTRQSSSSGGGHRSGATSGSSQTVVADVVDRMAKGGVKYVGEGESVYSAMRTMLERRVGSLVVKDDSERVTGFVTTRDLMRCVIHRGVLWNGSTEPQHWNVPISKIMTPSKDLVFLSPKDSLDDARALMSLSGKRHIPVISGSTMLGIITPKDIAHALHLEMDKGQTAKASYVTTVMPRMGMPLGTRLIDDGTEQTEQSYSLRSAVCNLPHPHKE